MRYGQFIIILVLALSSASCKAIGESDEQKKLREAKSNSVTEIFLKDHSDDFCSLLSIKYELSAELTRRIIDDFTREDSLQRFTSLSQAETMEEFELVKTKFTSLSVEERIRGISEEHNIRQSKIASLLIDYNIWHEAQYDETY